MKILDTNVISELITTSSASPPRSFFDDGERSTWWISAISVAELERGVQLLPPGDRRQRLERALHQRIFRPFSDKILNFGRDLATAWAHVMATEQRRGNQLSTADGILAATALAHDAVLVTRDKQLLSVAQIKTFNPWGSPSPNAETPQSLRG